MTQVHLSRRLLGQATGQPVNEASYEAPTSLRCAPYAPYAC